MATLLSVLLAGSALVSAQDFSGGARGEDAFRYVQPLDTVILTEHGSSPAVYPSPNATGAGGWEEALRKAKEFVAQLTVDEKSYMVSGQAGPCVGNIAPISRLGFPGLCLHDGPLAIRVADYASVFSAAVSAGASWDKELMYERGYALGEEFRAKGAHVALQPVAGPLGRSGYAGRNWEGAAADPYLAGIFMKETIQGTQDTGVQACAKHYIGNEQETQRNPVFDPNGTTTDTISAALSANIDDRTMHEIYLWPFADAAHAKVASFMCSYNRINGSYGCQNSKALNGLLKEELGFQGYVMSDWGATHTGVAGIEAGQDMDMPGGLGAYGTAFAEEIPGRMPSFFGGNVTLAVNNGSLAESRVDDMIVRIMTPFYALGQDKDFPTVDPSSAELNTFSPVSTWKIDWNLTGPSSRDVRGDHAKLIRKHGAAGSVLLKNTNGALPLKAPKNIAVFGNDAAEPTKGQLNQQNFEYGTLVAGGGSGTGQLTYVVTPLRAIQERAAQDNAKIVQYWLNNTLIADIDIDTLLIPDRPEVCIVLLKTWAEEATDRASLHVDWNGDAVVESVASKCNNTIVVTHSSGINVLPWADHENVTAILAAHFPGEESGHSLVDILYGDVNPSGHLPYTIALNGTDYNAPPTTAINTTGHYDWQSWFDEKLEVDYRYFDSHNISVRYEFGFGLSYTTFGYAALAAEPLSPNISALPTAQPVQPGGNPDLWTPLYNVSVAVSNTGNVAGHAVPQLYLGLPSSAPAGTPPKQLRGFEKVWLQPNETKTVAFELRRRDLSFWDVVRQDWVIPTGEFSVMVGESSRLVKAQKGVNVLGSY
ncbi:glycoside hydrolase family 3 protein [Karstenula rhodostoma CBS 690.94]|uniref:Probable beta-glucosidase G n=1 Tax=Karstenula rhodostoma CBS 690.94 TaxID=1392251 RepID=A0A9P4P7Z7_9PLEO|nr:glycoside hydrolase family 3 protein [Karstenula rhodostoma CBS 690.94]